MTDLTWVLSSCVLILAVIAIRAAFGKRMRPGLRYALWGLVLLRLLLPFEIGSSQWSVASMADKLPERELSENIVTVMGGDVPQLAPQVPDPSLSEIEQRELQREYWQKWERDVAQSKIETGGTPVTLRDVLRVVWLAGTAATAIVFLLSNLRFYNTLRKRRKPLDADCPLRVYSVENLSSSCLFGNTICVAAETAADETKLRHVLAHELSHHRHGDHVWALLRCVALSLHWYNPLVWWAAALSRQDSELCADAGALERLGEAERESYGATLIELSARRAPKASLLCTATTMTNGKKSLKERVTMIARRPRMTVAIVIAVVLIAAIAAGCAFAGVAAREEMPQYWYYAVETERRKQEYRADDGTVLATVDYELPRLTAALGAEGGEEPPEDMTAVCETFNNMFETYCDERIRVNELEESARFGYELSREVGGAFEPYADAVWLESFYQTDTLLSVRLMGYTYYGGAYPNSGNHIWNFDLENGQFVSLRDLSDWPDELIEAARWNIVAQVYEQELDAGYYDEWEDTLNAMDDFLVGFDADGMTVYFGDYELAPHAAGLQTFRIAYEDVAQYLNGRAERLLGLSREMIALGDYHEAEYLWNWFHMASAPVSTEWPEDYRTWHVTTDGAAWDAGYFRLNYRDVTTLTALRALLETRFSSKIVDALLAPDANDGILPFREFDGVLYALDAGMGSNIDIDSVDHAVELDGEAGGKVVATAAIRDWDREAAVDENGNWHYAIKEYQTFTFPFEWTENGARFLHFESIW